MCHDQADLVSLSTSILAPPDVADDLIRAQEIGEAKYHNFKQMRLEYLEYPPSIKFHDKMTKQNLDFLPHQQKEDL